MIEPYWGEFLVSPIPLELSLNYCSHSCHFCFANLGKPDRTVDIKAVMRFLRDYQNRQTLEAVLMKAGYPVLISNRVDPFAASNYKQALPVIETMTALGIPIAFQTRGGFEIDRAIDIVPPSSWYISINQMDDKLRKKIEPGATTIESRFELIQKLTERGHVVTLGLNPLVPQWMPEPEECLDRAKAAGASGAWIEVLHFNQDQVDNMTEKGKAAMGADVIATAKKKKMKPEVAAHMERAESYARQIGLEPFGGSTPFVTRIWDGMRRVYHKTFPVMQDWVNHCYVTMQPMTVFGFDDFADFMCRTLPEGLLRTRGYIGMRGREILKNVKIPQWMTYRQMLSIAWQYESMACNPANVHCFGVAAEGFDDDGLHHVPTDDNGLHRMVFLGSDCSHSDLYVQVENEVTCGNPS